jgi:beta-glucosidase
MKNIVGSRLPSFTKAQSEDVKGSLDFIGMNHYYSLYVNDRPLGKGTRDFVADISIYYRGSKTDPPPGKAAPTSIGPDPQGLRLMVQYLQETYGNLPIYILENGKLFVVVQLLH